MKPRMEQGMKQSMIATAAMQMYMRALQSNSTELEQMVSQALAANPVLEEDRSRTKTDGETYTHPTSKEEAYQARERHDWLLNSLTEDISLADHLEEQIRQNGLPEALEAAALTLIHNLNERAFFEEDPIELAQKAGFSKEESEQALQIIHDLEPAGVGACSLQESLLLQLQRQGEGKGIAAELISHHWESLIHHRYAEAAHSMQLEEQAIRGAAHRISRLNPDPGSGFCRTEQLIITPDVIVERQGDSLSVRLSQDNIPQLSLSADYRSMMAERADNTQLRQYLSKCFREGRELIHALEQRQQSILEVARALVVRQRDFFLQGPQALAPLKMEQLAEDTGMHVSTVSRAVRHKYLKCEHGVFELRRFFSTALSRDEGAGDISAQTVQNRIKELIKDEDKRKPLSDAKLENKLKSEGIQIARRTIAKYREQMKILPASLRKEK